MRTHYLTALTPVVALALLVSGCNTTSQSNDGVAQFDPIPPVVAGSEALDAVSPRTVTDLLRDADQAFQAANASQESGDEEAALRHYVLMLELLSEADLDPKIFYSLRKEFGNILDSSSQQAALFQPRGPSPLATATDYAPGDLSALEIPFPLPERVLQEIDEIQNVYPKNFQIFLDRSHEYLPYIKQRLREEGVPEEIAYLPIVESGFQPKIVSRAGASGMWQFMRPAARRFELRLDSHVDERYDWKSATDAAIKYLKILHNDFDGSWPLALSAYNMGEGGLARAIAANGDERDLWKLIDTPPASYRIRLETKKYYARFIATVIVASNPERYGFKSNPRAPQNSVKYPVKGMYALSDLDRKMGYSEGTLARLNPALLNETTPPGGTYHLLVPGADSEKLASALRGANQMKLASGTHKVKRGETFSQIASRHGITATELMRINGIRSARSLRAGQTLKLPGTYAPPARGRDDEPAGKEQEKEQESAPEVTLASHSPNVPAARKSKPTYVVKSGDTLFDIAKAHNVTVSELQAWNDKGRQARLRVGETLDVGESNIPDAPSRSDADSRYHQVRAGEYPARIARDYDIDLKDFLAWNGLGAQSTIKVGDKLLIAESDAPVQVASNAPAPRVGTNAGVPPLPKTHTVRKGESASVIAEKYGIQTSQFLAWNGLTSRSILRAGQAYKISAPDGKSGGDSVAEQIHKVAPGQNPTTIARRYGVKLSDLFKWNDWSRNHVLHVGDEVVIRKG